MATIHNSDLFKELTEGGRLQVSRESIPTQIADKVVPVMEVNPKLLRRAEILGQVNARTTSATGQTLMAAKPNQDVYITGLFVTTSQTAASDNSQIFINCTIKGATKYLYFRRKATLVATDIFDYLEFPTPIKIDINTAVLYTLAFTAGAATSDFSLIGYIVDNPNA